MNLGVQTSGILHNRPESYLTFMPKEDWPPRLSFGRQDSNCFPEPDGDRALSPLLPVNCTFSWNSNLCLGAISLSSS